MAKATGEQNGDGEEAVKTRKRQPRANRVRKLLLDVALDCFSTNGFNGTSTRMIAEASGFSHSLVTYHFESKDKLWIATMEEVIGSHASRVERIVNGHPHLSAADRLEIFIEEVVRAFQTKPQIHQIFTQQSTQTSERLDWLVDHYVRSQFEQVTQLIKEGQDEGAVREGDPARIYYFIISAAGMPFAVAREYKMLTGRDMFSPAEVYHMVTTLSDFTFSRTRPAAEPPADAKDKGPAVGKPTRRKVSSGD